MGIFRKQPEGAKQEFEFHMRPYPPGYSVWIHRVGRSPDYLDALEAYHCFTGWGAKRWGRKMARRLAERLKRQDYRIKV